MTNKLKEKIEAAKKELRAKYDLCIPMAQEAEEGLAALRETVAPFKVEIYRRGGHTICQYTEKINHFDVFSLQENDRLRLSLAHPKDPNIVQVIFYFDASPGKWSISYRDVTCQSFAELLEAEASSIAEAMLDLEHRWKMENIQ